MGKKTKRFCVSDKLTRADATFNVKNALLLSLITALLITAVMFLAVLRDNMEIDLRRMVVSLLLNLALSFLIFAYSFVVVRSRMSILLRWVVTITGSLAIAFVFSMALFNFHIRVYGTVEYPMLVSIFRGISAAIFAVFITLLLLSMTRQQRIELDNEHLRSENLLIRYDSLEKQLDPHFMFNSLNTLSGLIGVDDEKAQTYLQQLASTSRYKIQQNGFVTLAEELAFTNSYIYMMKIRYGENLTIQQSIPQEAMQMIVVPISLQLLVENALKHNVISDRHPLTVTIDVTGNNCLRVRNPKQPKVGAEPTTGFGLDNLAQRYELRFKKRISIVDSDSEFCVELPLIKEDNLVENSSL